MGVRDLKRPEAPFPRKPDPHSKLGVSTKRYAYDRSLSRSMSLKRE
jgi:hypothetical protein